MKNIGSTIWCSMKKLERYLVNETSHFLYENCDGQSVESLCELLFDQCIDKDQLDKRTVYEGCTKALETLLKMELLTIK